MENSSDDSAYIQFVAFGQRVGVYNDGNTLCTAVRQRVKYAQSEIHTARSHGLG